MNKENLKEVANNLSKSLKKMDFKQITFIIDTVKNELFERLDDLEQKEKFYFTQKELSNILDKLDDATIDLCNLTYSD